MKNERQLCSTHFFSFHFLVINSNVTPFSIENDNADTTPTRRDREKTYCIIPITTANSFKILNESKGNENVCDSILQNEFTQQKPSDNQKKNGRKLKEIIKTNDDNDAANK